MMGTKHFVNFYVEGSDDEGYFARTSQKEPGYEFGFGQTANQEIESRLTRLMKQSGIEVTIDGDVGPAWEWQILLKADEGKE
jgi:hypothetical protein